MSMLNLRQMRMSRASSDLKLICREDKMNLVDVSETKIRAAYDIEAAYDKCFQITRREGVPALLNYVTDKRLSEKGKRVRSELAEQMCIMSAWSGGNEIPLHVEGVFARCVYRDFLAVDDEMRGRYVRSAPFLAALSLFTDLDIHAVLDGEKSFAQVVSACG